MVIVKSALSERFVVNSHWNGEQFSPGFLKTEVGRGESELSRAKALKNFCAD